MIIGDTRPHYCSTVAKRILAEIGKRALADMATSYWLLICRCMRGSMMMLMPVSDVGPKRRAISNHQNISPFSIFQFAEPGHIEAATAENASLLTI